MKQKLFCIFFLFLFPPTEYIQLYTIGPQKHVDRMIIVLFIAVTVSNVQYKKLNQNKELQDQYVTHKVRGALRDTF